MTRYRVNIDFYTAREHEIMNGVSLGAIFYGPYVAASRLRMRKHRNKIQILFDSKILTSVVSCTDTRDRKIRRVC